MMLRGTGSVSCALKNSHFICLQKPARETRNLCCHSPCCKTSYAFYVPWMFYCNWSMAMKAIFHSTRPICVWHCRKFLIQVVTTKCFHEWNLKCTALIPKWKHDWVIITELHQNFRHCSGHDLVGCWNLCGARTLMPLDLIRNGGISLHFIFFTAGIPALPHYDCKSFH